MDAMNLPPERSSETSVNPMIHGMWVGSHLSRLELLTIHSFLRHGHQFNLWVYDDILTDLPPGTILSDAHQIMPRDMLFTKKRVDPETGVGAGSMSGISSDLFRYRLLHDHGGIWVDMDVTCLRPFRFEDPFVFRSHRVGCVGSIMKAPKGSRLMAKAYEATAAIAGEDTPWLEPLRILSRLVESEGLQRYIRDDIANPDLWSEYIRPLIENFNELPEEWVAIHWMNEFFRTLNVDEGHYKGRPIIDYTPDKENPRGGSLLHELYRSYGLVDNRLPYEPPAPMFRAPITAIAASPLRQINILVASLTRGGAERIVVETAQAMAAAGIITTVYVFTEVQLDYPVVAKENLTFKLLKGNRLAKLRSVALDLGCNGADTVQTHLIQAADLEVLWSFGIKTIPVVHNARPGWRDAATSYNHPNVPVVIAVADTVARQLKESGLQKHTLTIRHEIQSRPDIAEMAASRKAIRRKHDIRDDVFLIGMVGQFKMQKAYTRAIRLLAEIQKHMKAKLLIIGSWDHDYGSGRTAYQDAVKLAVELGVVADVITPGNLDPVEPYYSAFDVFLNTSIFEGLSISLLEAIAHGCRIVAANAGGTSEVLPPNSVLMEDGNDIQAYLTACLDIARQSRREIPAVPAEADIVMRLWSLLAPDFHAPKTEAVLFLTKNLKIGGPARALINLLRNSDADCKWIAGVIGDAEIPHVAALAEAQIPVLSAKEADCLAAQAELVIHWLRSYNLGTICFWNVGPELKLLLTKLLSHEKVRLIDVSPGPMLFDDMDGVASFQKRIAFSAKQYFSRLDHFVGLYDGGLPDDDIIPPERKSIIPCGVSAPPAFISLPLPEFLLPEKFEANLAIGTCCRIVPDKKLEFLLKMIDCLTARLPGVSLTVVGGPDASGVDYFDEILEKAAQRENVRFIGPQLTVQPYLQQFQVFVMVSDRQGCPNASLEAMAMGIPVVANPNGGTEEQVINGVTGFIVETPEEMAQSVMQLLTNQVTRQRMGRAAREHVLTNFSIEGVASEYRHLLSPPDKLRDRQGDQRCSA